MKPHLYERTLINLQKKALHGKEDVRLSDFTNYSARDISVISEPYPHIVLDNFFKPDIYNAYCDIFSEVFARGLTKDKNQTLAQFHAFDIDYDGYLYVPAATIDPENPMKLFYSLEWNNFFSSIFHQFTSFETSLGLHHHPPGDRTGFVHHDFADKNFNPKFRLENGVINAQLPNDATDGNGFICRRVISLLIYLNNEPWQEGDGGGTGVYSKDQQTLIKTVPPVNNRLFAFQTSPVSMHAFQSNKKNRNSIVQWFHAPPNFL
jgi:hypothetical protein